MGLSVSQDGQKSALCEGEPAVISNRTEKQDRSSSLAEIASRSARRRRYMHPRERKEKKKIEKGSYVDNNSEVADILFRAFCRSIRDPRLAKRNRLFHTLS